MIKPPTDLPLQPFRHYLRMALLALFAATTTAATSNAQISLASAVELAVRNSPRVKASEADLARARAVVKESTDVYIPTLNAGGGLGDAFGYSGYPPTLFSINSSSLVYNASQRSYTRSSKSGLEAAKLSLEDTREVVAEDAALTFIALQHHQQQILILSQESQFADRLLQIVQDRFDAGSDNRMMLLDARLVVANLHIAKLRSQEDEANDRTHLARLIAVPAGSLRADGVFPSTPIPGQVVTAADRYANSAVASAFANAKAKKLQAEGDSHFLFRPQFSLVVQYNLYETFTDAWKNIVQQYGKTDASGNKTLSPNQESFALQVNIPLLDRLRRSKALEATADATRALHDAEFAQMNVLDAQGRLNHNIELLTAQTEVAEIEQQRAQEQLEVLQLQLQSPGSTPVPMTPKEEQNARIAEREKFLGVIDASFQLHQAQISFLRQVGRLEDWLAGAGAVPAQPSTQP